MAYDLTREKGQMGAVLFCEEMIQEKKRQINEMEFYDGERISALQNSMMDWGAIRSRVEKGFAFFFRFRGDVLSFSTFRL